MSESAEPPGEKKKTRSLARSLASHSSRSLLFPSLTPSPLSLSPSLSLSLSFSRDGLPPEEDQARGRPRRRPRDRPRRLDCRGKRKESRLRFFLGGETA